MTRTTTLRPRQAEVLDHLLAGENTAEIARALTLSWHTVKRYLADLRAAYGARHTHHLTCLAHLRRREDERREAAEIERQRAVLARDLAREKARARVV